MPTHDPLGSGGRKHRRRLKLGPDARCLGCGRPNPVVLMKANRTMFEWHHPLGRAHVPDLEVPVCRNCHAEFSAAQVDDAVPLEPQPTVLERQAAIFQAFVSFLRALAEVLLEWALRAASVIAGLDADYPDWRTKSWAR